MAKQKKPQKPDPCPECTMVNFHKLDCTQNPANGATSPLDPTACDRCGEPSEEVLECPSCNETVCTDRCMAGRGVRCFNCEDARW